MKKFEILRELPKCDLETRMSKCCWKMCLSTCSRQGSHKPAVCKNTASAKHRKASAVERAAPVLTHASAEVRLEHAWHERREVSRSRKDKHHVIPLPCGAHGSHIQRPQLSDCSFLADQNSDFKKQGRRDGSERGKENSGCQEMGERMLENALGVISSQGGWRGVAGCRQRSGAPPYPPAGWSRIPRTDDSRAEGWRLASGRGPEHRPPFLLPTGPTVITARKK